MVVTTSINNQNRPRWYTTYFKSLLVYERLKNFYILIAIKAPNFLKPKQERKENKNTFLELKVCKTEILNTANIHDKMQQSIQKQDWILAFLVFLNARIPKFKTMGKNIEITYPNCHQHYTNNIKIIPLRNQELPTGFL